MGFYDVMVDKTIMSKMMTVIVICVVRSKAHREISFWRYSQILHQLNKFVILRSNKTAPLNWIRWVYLVSHYLGWHTYSVEFKRQRAVPLKVCQHLSSTCMGDVHDIIGWPSGASKVTGVISIYVRGRHVRPLNKARK